MVAEQKVFKMKGEMNKRTDEKILNYINGELCAPLSKLYLENYNPALGEVYSYLPDSDERDVEQAVEAAKKAFPIWSGYSIEERSNILMRLASLIEENLEFLAEVESIDNGKPIALARKVDIPRASANFKFFATAILHASSESHATNSQTLNYTLRQPIGVVGCISPWNLPLYLFSWKIAPALAAGNTVVAKPSEITPMSAYILSKLAVEAGFPAGVLNIVHGEGPKVGASIVEHLNVKAISFTGGTQTGATIAKIAAPMFKKLSLELGGKNPNIIFENCDFEKAVATSVRSSFSNQGQICLCGSRIFVQQSIYNHFKQAFKERCSLLKIGDPILEETQMGALVSKAHFEKVLSYIDLAKQEGGTILYGGKPVKVSGRCANGWFVEPTIIENLAYDCRTNQEEIFGPVVTLTPFENEEEVLAMANSTQYGLSATIWTKNLNKAHRIAQKIDAGIVWINCWLIRDLRTPFGGIKNSGVGREGGWEALRFFTEPKNVCIETND